MLSEILVESADWWIGRFVHMTSWSSGSWGFEGLGPASSRGHHRGWPRGEGLASMEQFAVSKGFVCYLSRCRSSLLSYKLALFLVGLHANFRMLVLENGSALSWGFTMLWMIYFSWRKGGSEVHVLLMDMYSWFSTCSFLGVICLVCMAPYVSMLQGDFANFLREGKVDAC